MNVMFCIFPAQNVNVFFLLKRRISKEKEHLRELSRQKNKINAAYQLMLWLMRRT